MPDLGYLTCLHLSCTLTVYVHPCAALHSINKWRLRLFGRAEAGQDYKEMATATTAAVFCLVHIMRTIWGLMQLQVFKEWSTEALLCLMRMGYEAPVYELLGKTEKGTEQFLTEDECHVTIDYHMQVNNTIVDNEFKGANLPFQFHFRSAILSLWEMLTSCSKFSISDCLEAES
eukprot:IDg22882t1